MPYSINPDPQAGLIELQVFGRSSAQEALEARLELARMAREHHIPRVLVSARQLEAVENFSPAILYSFASSFREKGFPAGTRFAIVPTRISKTLQICCRIARETGTRMQAFSDLRLALEWLFERITTSELRASS
ncbi:MAG: hypothetical protein P8X64_02975 [Anaerolineales bacterium]|jgi:hypothetical protein